LAAPDSSVPRGIIMKPSTGKKPYLVYLIYAALLLPLLLVSLMIPRYVEMQINDNARINCVGRLRMLSQKITKNILLYRDGAVQKSDVEKPLALFNESIHAVAEGGSIPLDIEQPQFMVVPEMDDRVSRRLLDIAIRQWEPFEGHVISYINTKNEASLKYILTRNDALVETLDRSVLAIQNHADEDQMVMGLLSGAAIIMTIIGITGWLIRQLRRYRSAVARLAEIERLLPICAGCKKIRTDNSRPFDPRSWTSIEEYLRDSKDMVFTHSLCPDCMSKYDPGHSGGGTGGA